jgi:hypothetical protein
MNGFEARYQPNVHGQPAQTVWVYQLFSTSYAAIRAVGERRIRYVLSMDLTVPPYEERELNNIEDRF